MPIFHVLFVCITNTTHYHKHPNVDFCSRMRDSIEFDIIGLKLCGLGCIKYRWRAYTAFLCEYFTNFRNNDIILFLCKDASKGPHPNTCMPQQLAPMPTTHPLPFTYFKWGTYAPTQGETVLSGSWLISSSTAAKAFHSMSFSIERSFSATLFFALLLSSPICMHSRQPDQGCNWDRSQSNKLKILVFLIP